MKPILKLSRIILISFITITLFSFTSTQFLENTFGYLSEDLSNALDHIVEINFKNSTHPFEIIFNKKSHLEKFYKTFGNHDLMWKNKADVFIWLRKYFTLPLIINEGIVIKIKTSASELKIFLTHGHQGDTMSDNNAFSTWVVAHLWLPLQRYLNININT